jgi:hypothetical protein
MPIGKKIEGGASWIEDPQLVKAFIQRLDDTLDSGADLDFAWVRTVKANTIKYNRYSLGQDWALKKIEDKIDSLQQFKNDNNDFFGDMDHYGSLQ